MKSLTSAPPRGLVAGVASLLVAGAASVLAASPAQAIPATGALTWNVSEQFVNHLSVRTLADGARFDEGAKTFSFPTKEVTTAPDGTVTTTFDGSVSGGFMALYSVTVSNPVLVVEADGDGRIQATVNSKGSNADPDALTPASQVTVAEFSGATKVGDTTTATPDWADVLPAGSKAAIDLGITDPSRPVAGKSFHPEFMAAIHPDIRAHFHYTSGSDAKRPGAVSAVASAAAPAVVPAITPTVISADPTNGVSIKAVGAGFTAVTNPGDAGVYVALAPADTVIDHADRGSLASIPAVDYVTPARFTDDTFTAVLNAPTEKLKPGTSYAIFTWQAHTHSNSTQDTKTPVTIDWTKLQVTPAPAPTASPTPVPTPVGPVVKSDAKMKSSVKKPTVRKAGKLIVRIFGRDDAATGKVTAKLKTPGKKKVKQLKASLNRKGKAVVKLPKAKRGQYKVVLIYTGDGSYNKARKVIKYRVR